MSFLSGCAGLFMTAKDPALKRQAFLSRKVLKKSLMEQTLGSNKFECCKGCHTLTSVASQTFG